MSSTPTQPTAGPTLLLARAVFVALLIAHVGFSLVGTSHGFLAGQEFRQTQTAISALFIQREHNFSLAYPTPILGKPWSVPMEFPLYQWTVVAVSNLTHLPLAPSGRLVSLACFYLTLPGLLLCLRRLAVQPAHRWIALSIVLLGPLYVFYSRAFLIESMALMASIWFIAAFLEAMESRHTAWMVVAILAGVVASTVKITTFSPYLGAAAIATIVHLWRVRPWTEHSLQAAKLVAARALGCTLPALIAASLWVRYSDNVKRQNISADFLISTTLTTFNFGEWSMRFTSAYWHELVTHWQEGLLPLGVILAATAIGLVWGGTYRWLIASLLGLFLGIQLVFAQLYKIHIYYLYANGVLLLLAVGLVICAAFVRLSRYPVLRHLPWVAVAMLAVSQFQNYRGSYLTSQQLDVAGGGEHTKLLEEITAPDDVIVVIGDDWCSIIPYYAGRRALMIPVWREENGAYLEAAFRSLKGSRVGAVILSKKSRSSALILNLAERTLQTLPLPAFSFRDDLVFYFHQDLQPRVVELLQGATRPEYQTLKLESSLPANSSRYAWKDIPMESVLDRSAFSELDPLPELLRTPLEKPLSTTVNNIRRFNAHAPSELVFALSVGPHVLTAEYGLSEESYTQTDGTGTDGVEFSVLMRVPSRADRAVARYMLNPRELPADRGMRKMTLNFQAPSGAQLILRTTPGPRNDTAFDWAYWGRVQLR